MSKIILTASPNKLIVRDSFIKSIVMGKKSKQVKISFQNGSTKLFKGTTEIEFEGCKTAESLGTYFVKQIRNNPKFEAVDA